MPGQVVHKLAEVDSWPGPAPAPPRYQAVGEIIVKELLAKAKPATKTAVVSLTQII